MSEDEPRTNTLIVSDLHIGAEGSRVKECRDLLESYREGRHQYRLKRVILLGDVFDSMDMSRVRSYGWRFLGTIREMTDPESQVEVAWIRGNHDPQVIELVTNLVGAKAYEQYKWKVGGRRFFAIHGDQFDSWILNWPRWVGDVPDWCYRLVQKFDGSKHRFSRYLKEQSRDFLRLNDEVSVGVVKYMRHRLIRADAVFCGHTHLADRRHFERERVWYYNTGCWTGFDSPTYATIDDSGTVEVREYPFEQEE